VFGRLHDVVSRQVQSMENLHRINRYALRTMKSERRSGAVMSKQDLSPFTLPPFSFSDKCNSLLFCYILNYQVHPESCNAIVAK